MDSTIASDAVQVEDVNDETTADDQPVEVEPEPAAPQLLKRELKARDVKRFGRILGKVREMSVARANAIANAEGRTAEDPPVTVDAITMLLTDGLDYAEKEINLWFAELCGVELTKSDAEAWRQHRAEKTGNPEYRLSKWDLEDALSEKIADMSLDFYTDVIAELEQFGGLADFLTGLTRLSRRMGSSNPNSTN